MPVAVQVAAESDSSLIADLLGRVHEPIERDLVEEAQQFPKFRLISL